MKLVGFTFNVSYIVLFLVFSPPTLSYEVRTHEALTAEAIKNSLYKIDISHTLGLTLGQQLPDPILMNCIGSVSDPQNDDCDYLGQRGKGSYVGLILNGSSYEDLEYTPWYLRSLSHFYDPVNDRGLTPEGYVGTAVSGVKKIISFILTYSMYSYLIPPSLNLDGTAFGYKNPDWAFNNLLPDSQKVMIKIPQFYSYPDAYTYLYLALTSKNDSDRDKYFGKAFQALGQVSHLLQDMAAIEHVRNDAHLPFLDSGLQYMSPTLVESSRYEKYTNNLVKAGRLSFTGHFRVDTPVNFSTARRYWVSLTGGDAKYGHGLSEFTNTNFFTQDTNLGLSIFSAGLPVTSNYYNLPAPLDNITATTYVPVRQLFTELPENIEKICPINNSNDNCVVGFIRTNVHDSFSGQDIINDRAATYSIFFTDFEQLGGQSINITGSGIFKLFSLNRFNFDAMHKFLIPRAVAYSAGLLNHFFRGKLEISRPDTGFYFDVDNIVNQSYTTVSLQAKNITELAGSTIQNMSGDFEVVIRYTLPNNTEEKVSNSSNQTTTLLVGNVPSKLTFDLSTPVPVDAENVNLYLVYRGTLGEEPDVVAVSRVEITDEPFKLEVSLPEEGVYSIIDHATVNQIDQGFNKIKLKLKQTPIRSGSTAVTSGTLSVVASYNVDNCYQADLSNYLSPMTCFVNNYQQRRNNNVYYDPVANSAIQAQLVNTNNQTLTFEFPVPIPLSATNLRLELFYNFKVGNKDMMSWLSHDISEPTYFSLFNSTDNVLLNQLFHSKEAVLNDTSLFAKIDKNGNRRYDPDLGDYNIESYSFDDLAFRFNDATKPVARINTYLKDPSLKPASYVRMVFLGSPLSNKVGISYYSWSNGFGSYVMGSSQVLANGFNISQEQNAKLPYAFSSVRNVPIWKGLSIVVDPLGEIAKYSSTWDSSVVSASYLLIAPENLAPKPIPIIFPFN